MALGLNKTGRKAGGANKARGKGGNAGAGGKARAGGGRKGAGRAGGGADAAEGAGAEGGARKGGGLQAALKQARVAALAFRKITGRPLGAASGLGLAEAARVLGLKFAAPEAAFDATDPAGRRVKVAVRGAKGEIKGPLRLGGDEAEWDALVLVMLDARYQAKTMFEADRAALKAAAGDKPRLSVADYRKVAKKTWESAEADA